MERTHKIRLFTLGFFLLITATIWVAVFAVGERGSGMLRVVFFDVGQGDAVFIESPTGTQVLIDGGQNASVLRALSREMDFFDRTIDVVVATHPDADHVGGLVDVLRRYKVATILKTENTGESMAAQTFFSLTEEEGAEIVDVRRGMVVDLGGGAELSVLFPDRDPHFLESNTASIIMRLVFGESEFLFTGDAPKGIEEHLVGLDGEGLRSDVLKVGHHGSRTSTSEIFLSAVDPEHAVISAGRDNRYGHPHDEVISLLAGVGVEIFSTQNGYVVFESDGASVVRR